MRPLKGRLLFNTSAKMILPQKPAPSPKWGPRSRFDPEAMTARTIAEFTPKLSLGDLEATRIHIPFLQQTELTPGVGPLRSGPRSTDRLGQVVLEMLISPSRM